MGLSPIRRGGPGLLTRPAHPDPRTTDGLFRGRAADRVPALLGALALGLVAPLGTQVAAPEPAPAPAVVAPPAPTARPVVLTDLPVAGPQDRRVALTFDDGPDPQWTPQILDVLIRHGAKATFCMVGTQMERHPEVVAKVVDAGMRICSHSHTHDEGLPNRDAGTITAEIADVAARVPGTPVTYFRAPGGNWDEEILDSAVAQGMQPLGWAIDPRDWTRPAADEIVANVEKHLHPGAVVLLHDGGGSRARTVEALDRLLPRLRSQGYVTDFP
ncbi:polysaccharide deacetylase family protein [Pseudonocardia kujensis]|uniref:polysaccharide deacetylase family protein n=1 Tax=Pseudonocardia kujensis TaxID=1128675 RepID=UPI001E2BA9A5|nr:polysaccharide deacetylase family protein [Pseudonocardia kujensis]MCE0766586.1 polysaccharide deacetylase family protein [Pseudonocardia kujensis]